MEKYLGDQSPERLLAGVAAGIGIAGGVFSNVQTEFASPLSGTPPEVDGVSVQVITDSYHHFFEASGKIGDVQVLRQGPSDDPPRRLLQSEWGLSLHLESRRATDQRRVLIDFGYTPETINNNLDLLGIDLAKLDAMVLTHGHYDHFGGMVGFLQAHRRKLKPALPFFLGGEECFCSRETGPTDKPRNFGVLNRRAIAEAALRVMLAPKASIVADHGFTTGWIPQVSFEKPAQPSRMKIGIGPDGMGCEASLLPEAKRNAVLMVDDFQHEHAICFNVKDKGLVIITSCGHRGVVNTVQAAITVSGISKVHAVLGGFHLMPMPAEYARETAQELAKFKPDWLIPMHCSGETFIEAAKQAMPGKVLRTSTGTRFVFGA